MENHIIHVEFFGLPGSGKTTISHQLADRLRMNGFTIFEPTYSLAFKRLLFFRKLYQFIQLIRFIIKNPKAYKFLTEIIENNKCNRIEKLNQLFNVAYKLLIYEKAKSGIYFWDEGLLQSAISLSVNTNNDIKTIRNRFFNKNTNMITVYIKIDCNIAIERMNKRPTNDSRTEKLNSEQLKLQLIKEFEKKCGELSYDFCFCSINADNIVNSLYFTIYEKLIDCRFKKITS